LHTENPGQKKASLHQKEAEFSQNKIQFCGNLDFVKKNTTAGKYFSASAKVFTFIAIPQSFSIPLPALNNLMT